MESPRTVVLRNKIDDPLGQAHLFRELCSVGHVADDDLGALCGFQAVMRVLAQLIFDEMLWCRRLPNVVIEGSDPRKQSITADDATSFFSELSDGMRMLVRARRS